MNNSFFNQSFSHPHYMSDGHETMHKQHPIQLQIENNINVKCPPFSSQLPEKKFYCPSIFPNDDIKFVSKRKNKQNISKNDEIRNSERKKVEIRSCDPCNIF